MRDFECTASMTYQAAEPSVAARDLIANIQWNPEWFVQVKDLDSGRKFTVDTLTGAIEPIPEPSPLTSKKIQTITVKDPDSGLDVDVDVVIIKLSNGAMMGVDESFLANTDEPLYSPYDKGDIEINVDQI